MDASRRRAVNFYKTLIVTALVIILIFPWVVSITALNKNRQTGGTIGEHTRQLRATCQCGGQTPAAIAISRQPYRS
jgi:uncharacterized membrane protein (DUF106 family)